LRQLDANRLDRLQLRALREAILDAFEPGELQRLLSDRMGKDLRRFVAEGTFEDQVFELLNAFRGRGWLEQLVKAIEAERPDNASIARLRVTLGLLVPTAPPGADAATASGPDQLERLLRGAAPYVDFGRWLVDLMALQGRVCRVEAKSFGTGFLVASDLVLTNHHVVAAEICRPALAREMVCRFDYSSTGGPGVRDGREVRFAEEWLLAHCESSPGDATAGGRDPLVDELDYALLRLAEPAGEDPLGQRSRGAVALRRDVPEPKEGSVVQIVQHPKAGPLAMSIGTVREYGPGRRRMRYAANTEGGSSGSPVLTPDLTVVALHHAGGPDEGTAGYNQGIPIGLILQNLEVKSNVPRFWS
jgi:Trypsin-like peptidase domain/Effector-associated domain 1